MLQAVFNETLGNTANVQEHSSGVGISLGSQHHKTVELEGTFGSHVVQPPYSSRATQSWLPRTVSTQLLKISRKGDFSTCTSAQSPSHWKIVSWCSDVQFVPIAWPIASGHHWKKAVSILFVPFLYICIYIHWKCSPSRLNSLSSFSLFLQERWSNSLVILVTLHWALLKCSIIKHFG